MKAVASEDNWFGKRLRAFRELARVSQMKLAEQLGVSVQTIKEWERGAKHPHLKRIPALALALGIDAGKLFPSPGNVDAVHESLLTEPELEQALHQIRIRLNQVEQHHRAEKS